MGERQTSEKSIDAVGWGLYSRKVSQNKEDQKADGLPDSIVEQE